MASYKNATFNQLSERKQELARETIAQMWADGFTTEEISKKVKLGTRSVAVAMGNLTRRHLASKKSSPRRSR